MSAIVGSSLNISGSAIIGSNLTLSGNVVSNSITCNTLNTNTLNSVITTEVTEFNNSQQSTSLSSTVNLYNQASSTGQINFGISSRNLAINSPVTFGSSVNMGSNTISSSGSITSSASLNAPLITCNNITPYSGSSITESATTINKTATNLNLTAPNIAISGDATFSSANTLKNNSLQPVAGTDANNIYTTGTGQITLGNSNKSLSINSYINSDVNLNNKELYIYQAPNILSQDAIFIRNTGYSDGSPNYLRMGLTGANGGACDAYIDAGRFNGNGSDIVFRLNGKEYMRLENQYTGSNTTGAYLGVNKNNPTQVLDVSGNCLISGSLTSGACSVSSLNASGNAVITGTLNSGALTASSATLGSTNISSGNSVYLNLCPLYLSNSGDTNHGLRGPSSQFSTIDGPQLFGFNNGILGTTISSSKIALKWDSGQNVQIYNNCDISGNLTIRSGKIDNTVTGNPIIINTNVGSSTTISGNLTVNNNLQVLGSVINPASGSTLSLNPTNSLTGITSVAGLLTVSGATATLNNASANTYQYKYGSIPTLTSQCIGFSYTSQTTTATTFTNGTVKNLTSLTVVAGIYQVNYSISYYSIHTGGSGVTASVPITYGISTSNTTFSASQPCCYFTVNQGFQYSSSSYTNTYIMNNNCVLNTSSFGSLTVYLNVLIGTNSVPNTQYISDFFIQAVRIG